MKPLILLVLAFSSVAKGQIVEFKLLNNYLIVAKCSVGNAQDLVAIVDTGVTETVIDLKLVRRLSLTTTPDSATFGIREASVRAVAIPDIVLGPLHAQGLSGIAADLSHLTQEFGIRPDVLIGLDLLRRGPFLIDYRKRQVLFGPLPQLAHSAHLLLNMRLLLVQTAVDKQTLTLQVDTGINSILIYNGKLHVQATRSFNSRSNMIGVSGAFQVVSLPRLQIGDWRGTQIAASLTDDAPRDVQEFDGLLGPTAIGVHRIGFDFEKLVVAWE